jgi:hypothetical protein
MIKSLFTLAALLASTCQVGPFPKPTPQPEPPDPWNDAALDAGPTPTPPPVPGASCADACARLTALGCPGAKPTPRGASCVEVCQNTLGSPVSLQTDCIARASDCPAANACAAIPQ